MLSIFDKKVAKRNIFIDFAFMDERETAEIQKQLIAQAFGDKDPDAARIGRNEPCPCGSGKKYKQCHGRIA